jgi:hypothetical protein
VISGRLPELRVTSGKRHVPEGPWPFDVLAIDNEAGKLPVVRLHQEACGPQM